MEVLRAGKGYLRAMAFSSAKNREHPQQKPLRWQSNPHRSRNRLRLCCAILILLTILANTVAFEILQQLKFKFLTKLMVDDHTVSLANSFLRRFDEATHDHIAESPLRHAANDRFEMRANRSLCKASAHVSAAAGWFCRQWRLGDRCSMLSLGSSGTRALDVFLRDTEGCEVFGHVPARGARRQVSPQFLDGVGVDFKFRSSQDLSLLGRSLREARGRDVDVLRLDVGGAEWFLLNEVMEVEWQQLIVHMYLPEQFECSVSDGVLVLVDTWRKRGVVDPAAWLAYLQRYAHAWHFERRGQGQMAAYFVRKKTQKRVVLSEKNILWSRNWHRLVACESVPKKYYEAGTEARFSAAELRQFFSKCSGLIWIRLGSFSNNDLGVFIEEVLPIMTQPFTLVTSDGDNRVPGGVSNARKLLDNPYLQRWFTQNYDGTIVHGKLRPIPIGFDLHTHWSGLWSTDVNKNLEHMKRMRLAMRLRKDEVLLDAMGMYKVRRDMDTAVGCVKHLHLGSLPIDQLWNKYTVYRFGLSPHGNGLDCHRTWEMLFFGIIPIVKTSSLDSLYDELPVVILDDWDDICDSLKFELAFERAKPYIQVPSEMFTTSYWINR